MSLVKRGHLEYSVQRGGMSLCTQVTAAATQPSCLALQDPYRFVFPFQFRGQVAFRCSNFSGAFVKTRSARLTGETTMFICSSALLCVTLVKHITYTAYYFFYFLFLFKIIYFYVKKNLLGTHVVEMLSHSLKQ